jgi:hypothetical protein
LCPLVRYLEDCCAAHPRDENLKKEDGVRQLKELYQFRRVLKSWIIKKKFRNTIMLDPLGCLGAAASLDKAKAVMADCFHLNSRARDTVAGRIKEQIVGWLRGKKRGSDTPVGGDNKRFKMDASAGGKPGAAAGSGSKRAAGAGSSRTAAAGPSRKGDGGNRTKPGGKGQK